MFDKLNPQKLHQNKQLCDILVDLRHGSKHVPDANLQKVYMGLWAVLGPHITQDLDQQLPSDEMAFLAKWIEVTKPEIAQHVYGVLAPAAPDQPLSDNQMEKSLTEILEQLRKID